MIRRHFQYRETITTLLADAEDHIDAAIEGMLQARTAIERYIARDPFFAITYSPCTIDCDDITVKRMCHAAERARVGPMAAVAGAISWTGMEAMQKEGALFGVIDNGGDISLLSDRPVRVGIHAGEALISDRLAFLIPPQDQILGICTSSATVGPSVSLGVADAVTVFSHDVAVADAWATALCNRLSWDNKTIQPLEDPLLQGVLAIQGTEIRTWGNLPPLVPAKVDHDLITRGKAVHPGSDVPLDKRLDH
jgi:ApbE superfamily uncharacterized protein (UPF0280 family)